MIITKETQEAIIEKYIKLGKTTDECIGFIDGINEIMKLIEKLSK